MDRQTIAQMQVKTLFPTRKAGDNKIYQSNQVKNWPTILVHPDNKQNSSILIFSKDDGGSPISHYVVEQKDKSGNWKPVSKFCRTPKCDIDGLEEGEKYEFRVKAVNEHGDSEPLVTTKPITAKHPFGRW